MSFIESYEDQIVAAARRRQEGRPRVRLERRLRVPRRRGLAAALAALVAAVPVAGAAVSGWDPFDDPGANPRFAAPSLSRAAVSPDLVAMLGVLRRPQTDADRAPATSRAAGGFRLPGYVGAHLDGIRLVDPARGVVLVPFDRIPVPTDAQGRPLPEFDPSTYTNAVCLFIPTSDGFAADSCHTAGKIRLGRALGSSGGVVDGLVPDGVARVRLVRGDRAVEAPVADNFFSVDAPAPTSVDWIGPDGALVKRIDLTAPAPVR